MHVHEHPIPEYGFFFHLPIISIPSVLSIFRNRLLYRLSLRHSLLISIYPTLYACHRLPYVLKVVFIDVMTATIGSLKDRAGHASINRGHNLTLRWHVHAAARGL